MIVSRLARLAIPLLVPEYSEKHAPITLRQLAGHLGGIRHYGLGEFINVQ